MTEYVSNCCDAPSDPDMERCSDCKEGCQIVEVEDEHTTKD